MNSRRSSIRFPLELPTVIRWVEGDRIRTLHTQTKNMSSSGLYLVAESQDQPSARFEFEVQLSAGIAEGARVSLRGKGRLVRREEREGNRVGFAAVIDRYGFFTATAPVEIPLLESPQSDLAPTFPEDISEGVPQHSSLP